LHPYYEHYLIFHQMLLKIEQYGDYLFVLIENSKLGMSIDKGRTWSLIESKDKVSQVNDIDVYDEQSMIMACDNGCVAISTDAGIKWKINKITENDLNGVYASSRCDWWVVGDEGFVAYSTNAGGTWTQLDPIDDDDLRNVYMNENCSEGWIVGDDGMLIHVYDKRHAQSLLEEDDKDEKLTWANRTSIDIKKMYENLHDPNELVQGLYLEVKPEDATVQIKDHTYSGGELKIALPPGHYDMIVSREGLFTQKEEVEIELGEVETEYIYLRPIKVIISPSGGMSFSKENGGALFTLQASVLGYKKNSLGVLGDVGLMVNDFYSFADLYAYYSHRFAFTEKILLSPFAAVGLAVLGLTEDSLVIDSSFVNDTTVETTSYTVYDATYQAGINMVIKQHENWGFTIRPSIAYTREIGYTFRVRFGALFWIL